MNAMNGIIIVANDVNLRAGWSGLWGAATSGWGGLARLLMWVGVALVVIALVKWAWDRRRSGGMQGSGPMWGALIPGAILVAPAVLIPMILFCFDFIANIVVSILRGATGAR